MDYFRHGGSVDVTTVLGQTGSSPGNHPFRCRQFRAEQVHIAVEADIDDTYLDATTGPALRLPRGGADLDHTLAHRLRTRCHRQAHQLDTGSPGQPLQVGNGNEGANQRAVRGVDPRIECRQ